MSRLSRRDLLKGAALLGAAVVPDRALALRATASQDFRSDASIAGRSVRIVITSISALTARITLLALDRGGFETVPPDGSLDAGVLISPVKITDPPIDSAHAGDLTITISREPLIFRIAAKDGRTVQRLRIDAQTGAMTFLLGEGPLLGLGEGGPQFDRRGSADRMRSGQGGYQLRTHGGRVPIPWLIGTGGWAMFVHQPFGTFDLTGDEGRFDAGGGRALPLDVFVVGARESGAIMAEYAKAHRISGDAAALVVRLPAVAPHAGEPRGDPRGGEDLSREEAAVRHADLSRHRLLPVGLEHRQRRVHVQHEGRFPIRPRCCRQTARDHFKVVLHVVIEGRHADRDGQRSVHRAAAAERTHARWHAGRRPAGELLLAGAPAASSISASTAGGPIRATASTRPSRLARIRMYLGGLPQAPAERAAVRAAPQRLRRHAALRARSSGRATCTRRGRR